MMATDELTVISTQVVSALTAPTMDILWVEPDAIISAWDFGWKAANLCRAQVITRRTPPGFAISKSLVNRIARNKASASDVNNLYSFYIRLTKQIKTKKIIVRSSSCVEDAAVNSFAGLFQTVQNVHSFDELISAIQFCHESAESDQVKLYAKLRGVQMPDEHLALLVQQQIPILRSALIQISKEGYLFEAYEGDLTDRIRGAGAPEYVVVSRNGHTDILRGSERLPDQFLEELGPVARDVKHFITDHLLPFDAILETATDGTRLNILQLNLVSSSHAIADRKPGLVFDVRGTPLAMDEPKLGLKGSAMKYFHDTGLFDAPLCVFPCDSDIAAIADCVTKKFPCDGGYTVRFSHDAELGLPRCFLRDRDEIPRWIRATRRNEWTTITHPYIDVNHSFELLLTKNYALLEHIPGMWESDNVLDPDVIIMDAKQVRVWRCTHARPARFAQPNGWHKATVSPLTKADFNAWVGRLSPLLEQLRRDFSNILPLNFHFVEDREKHWYFLNIRRGFNLDLPAITRRPPHVVSKVADLETWDGLSPILLRFTSARGAEREVLSIAERLPKHDRFALLVDFGLLSHPAMILRELGFRLVPSYLYFGNRLQSPSYEKLDCAFDHGNDPIQRIRLEPTIYADTHVRVVADRDPLVPGHLLAVAEMPIRSFADSDYAEVFKKLLQSESPIGMSEGWILVERGRAQFCTSGFTDKHAHAHLLPAKQFDDRAADDFAIQIGATRRDSLSIAMREAKEAEGEYILVISQIGKVYLRLFSSDDTVNKRLIRTFFSTRLQ